MVGTIASRWAREATSGTIPPKRACSSSDEATASYSRARPRTRAIPVSSQEVSIPKMRGSSRSVSGMDIRLRLTFAALLGRQYFQVGRSEEHTSELQSRGHLVCRLLLDK